MELNLTELFAREREQVEWKENVADIDDVVATLSAFANDWANLGGGYVVCGAREDVDEHGFATVRVTGLEAPRLREIEGKALTRCRDRVTPPITPIVREIEAPDPSRRVLVFVMPATEHAHTFRRRSDSGKYYIGRGRSTQEARNGLFRELMVRKRALAPWDRRPQPDATTDDIDLLVLRDTLRQMARWDPDVPIDDYLGQRRRIAEFVPSLCVTEALTGISRPRNFALLLFGRDHLRFFPGAYAILSTYPGTDRSERHGQKLEISGPLFEQIRRIKDRLATHTGRLFDKEDPHQPNVTKYPSRALEEAAINALVRRDYEVDDPVRITVFSDRIEIVSPGGLPSQVDRERFLSGRAPPVWRNQALAWLCDKLQLAQAEGQGVPTIFRLMEAAGCPPPEYLLDGHSVTCILRANPRATRIQRLLDEGPTSA